MKKRIFAVMAALAVMLILPAAMPSSAAEQPKAENYVVADGKEATASLEEVQSGVIKARFENMLSLNFVYGEAFNSDKRLIEESMLALLDYSAEGQIDEGLVLSFIANMYGREVDASSCKYEFAPADEGKLIILPRGYSEYSHEITSVTKEEGGYTVLSDMTVNPHDSDAKTVKVKTVFVENEGSKYGYNIISSDMI